jgi:hypothetical protein
VDVIEHDERVVTGDVLSELRRGPVRLLDRKTPAESHRDRKPVDVVGLGTEQRRSFPPPPPVSVI